ncbi:MAG: hypothetical protein BWY79_00156 [Actinobacteria bacterium ADurb.Bin444]|nr:MAG: hypothetical protein BWY79_00156 [Actinobacteria bacterium ADurb.Bin444]
MLRTTNSTWNISKRRISMPVSDVVERKCVGTPASSNRLNNRADMALFMRPLCRMVPFFLPSKAVAASLKSCR